MWRCVKVCVCVITSSLTCLVDLYSGAIGHFVQKSDETGLKICKTNTATTTKKKETNRVFTFSKWKPNTVNRKHQGTGVNIITTYGRKLFRLFWATKKLPTNVAKVTRETWRRVPKSLQQKTNTKLLRRNQRKASFACPPPPPQAHSQLRSS